MSDVNNTLLMQRLSQQLEKLKPKDDGDSGGGNMEARIAKLESDVGHIKNDIKDVKIDMRDIKKEAREDFRILFGSIIVATLGVAGLLAKGFHWL